MFTRTSKTESFIKVSAWLLKNVNPELEEIQSSVKKITEAENSTVSPFTPTEEKPTSLSDVLKEVLRLEQVLFQVCKQHDSSFSGRDMPEPVETPSEIDKVSFLLNPI